MTCGASVRSPASAERGVAPAAQRGARPGAAGGGRQLPLAGLRHRRTGRTRGPFQLDVRRGREARARARGAERGQSVESNTGGPVPRGRTWRQGARSSWRSPRSAPTCHGSGAAPGASVKVCPECSGRGVDFVRTGRIRRESPVSHVHGSRPDPHGALPDLQGHRRGAHAKEGGDHGAARHRHGNERSA